MVKASTILLNAATALQDHVRFARWPLQELYRYLQDGLYEIVRLVPQAHTARRVLALGPGPLQEVNDAYAILEVTANILNESPLTFGRIIKRTSRDELDQFDPEWSNTAPTSTVRSYAPNPVHKTSFWVYPPNDGTGKVQVQVSVFPDAPAPTGDGLTLADYEVELPIDAVFAPALTYYIQHRAWQKDADFAANQANSNRCHDLFLMALGMPQPAGATST